jgi:hypothetical protein
MILMSFMAWPLPQPGGQAMSETCSCINKHPAGCMFTGLRQGSLEVCAELNAIHLR